jgi:hypothetical protein
MVMAPFANAQLTLLNDGFESGYTNEADLIGVNGWQVFQGSPVVKTIQSTGSGNNNSDWFVEFRTGGYQEIQMVKELVSGETYNFKAYVKRSNGFSGKMIIRVMKLGDNVVETDISADDVVNSGYTEKSLTFVADESVNYGFRIQQKFGTSYFQIDDVEITCTTCPTASVSKTNHFQFNVYPNPAKDIIKFQSDLPLETVELFALTGAKILQVKVKDNINVNGISPGVYVLKVHSENGGTATKKLIKN